MYDEIRKYLILREAEQDQIDVERRALLDKLSAYLRKTAPDPVRLLFVCTHNSRRSQLAQAWAAAAAKLKGRRISAYSGGTEATALAPPVVAALERAGFQIQRTSTDSNPIYHVHLSDDGPALTCFSKKFDHPSNPQEGFAAVMVCTEADGACPTVPGASARFAIPCNDPKHSDGTPEEAATYDACSAQIAREMLYVVRGR